MANLTTAKVRLTAHRVGPELKRYIDLSLRNTYDILGESGNGYSVQKSGETWTFEGYGTGRWNYGRNVEGYFGGDEWWVGPDSDEGVCFTELATAITSRAGYVAIEWADYDPGEWIGRGEAYLGTDEAGDLSFSGADLTATCSYDLANLMAAFDLTLADAIIEHAGDEEAESFWNLWKQWDDVEQPSPEEAFRWLLAMSELEFAECGDELSKDAGFVVLSRLKSATHISSPRNEVLRVTLPGGTYSFTEDRRVVVAGLKREEE